MLSAVGFLYNEGQRQKALILRRGMKEEEVKSPHTSSGLQNEHDVCHAEHNCLVSS